MVIGLFVLLKMSVAGIQTHTVASVSNLHLCSLAFPRLLCQSSQIPTSGLRKWPLIVSVYFKLGTTKTFRKQCWSGTRPHRKHNALQRRTKGRALPPSLSFLSYPSHIYFIRCILHRLLGGGMVMCSDTHTHTHTQHRCPLVHVVMLFPPPPALPSFLSFIRRG